VSRCTERPAETCIYGIYALLLLTFPHITLKEQAYETNFTRPVLIKVVEIQKYKMNWRHVLSHPFKVSNMGLYARATAM